MIQTSLIRNTFEYFAKFPLIEGVMKSFTVSSSARFGSDYTDFKTKIQNLAENSLIPGITDYVFGVDEESVKARIRDISGVFLFVDYGAITLDEDRFRTITDSFLLAITVAIPVKPESIDNIESLLYADQMLNFIRQILKRMNEDSRNSPFLREFNFPAEITPFFARELFNSTGFTMLFTKSGIDLIE